MAATPVVAAEVLAEVAAGAAADAGGLPVELLGNFLDAVADAVVAGKPLSRRHMLTYKGTGGAAARQGVALRALLDLYLSAAWRLWRHLPAVLDPHRDPEAVVVAGEVMLHACDDAVAALAEGFQLARRALVHTEVSARREFIDDLLTGGGDVAGVLQRAGGYGLDLSGPHAVAVVGAERPFADGNPLIGTVERAIQGRQGDAEALVASKEGRLVVVFPAPARSAVDQVLTQLCAILGPRPGEAPQVTLRRKIAVGTWQIGVGRSAEGARGVVTSYQEACDALTLAGLLNRDSPVVHARDLLVYNVLLRDRPAITDLVDTVLTPLLTVRGGARPLLETLSAYFNAGAVATEAARHLHLSVRAVTYRLDRVRDLTGHDPGDPADRFILHVAVLGAQLLDWPPSAHS